MTLTLALVVISRYFGGFPSNLYLPLVGFIYSSNSQPECVEESPEGLDR